MIEKLLRAWLNSIHERKTAKGKEFIIKLINELASVHHQMEFRHSSSMHEGETDHVVYVSWSGCSDKKGFMDIAYSSESEYNDATKEYIKLFSIELYNLSTKFEEDSRFHGELAFYDAAETSLFQPTITYTVSGKDYKKYEKQ